MLGQAYGCARRYDEAVAAMRDKAAPPSVGVGAFVAAALAQAGRLDQARAIMDEFRQAAPGATVSVFAGGQPYNNPADLQHLLDGMRKAGMPE